MTDNPLRSKPQPDGVEPLIALTGERPNGRLIIRVRGKPVPLMPKCHAALLRLIAASVDSSLGYVREKSVLISRMRKDIDRVVGKGVGREIIETGDKSEYRLAVPTGDVRSAVVIEEPFFELLRLGRLTLKQARQFRRLFPVRDARCRYHWDGTQLTSSPT
jgi:hypothetical protein